MQRKTVFMLVLLTLPLTISATTLPVALWQFDNADQLGQATLGEDLVLTGTADAVAGIADGDGAARIGVGSYFTAANTVGPNGGDGSAEYTNQWTLLYDIKFPLSESYSSLFQTQPANSNDGDLFTRSSGALGVGATGYAAAGTLQADTWYRLIVRADNGNLFQLWLDGQKVLEGTSQGVDGRFGLEDTFLLFADNDGEEEPVDVSLIAFWGETLTENQISELGTAGVPVPEPASLSLLILGAASCLRRGKR